MNTLILDGYVDEPALFGVPPFLSTYTRYIYGAYRCFNVQPDYLTIDALRSQNLWESLDAYDQIVIVGGVSVPGKYAGGSPLSENELMKIGILAPKPLKILFGPFVYRLADLEKQVSAYQDWIPKKQKTAKNNKTPLIDCAVTGNIETYLFHLLKGDNPPEDIRKEEEITERVACMGAEVVKVHPNYPDIVCEMEISSGCERKTHCSFCSEPVFHKRFHSRDVSYILQEIQALSEQGISHFRLGRTANILAYADEGDGPNPQAVQTLYKGIRDRVPALRTLHTDNANPHYIVQYAERTSKIIETIATYNTPGDILSFGVESFDDTVIRKNNLGFEIAEIFQAVEIVNRIGGFRKNTVPALLPGINLLFGLIGETKQSFLKNYEALESIVSKGWLLRRINLRQVMVFPSTPLWEFRNQHYLPFHKTEFRTFKEAVRTNIDRPLLRKVFPSGTILNSVKMEYKEGNITFGRPLWTYGILVGVKDNLEIGKKYDIRVTDHGFRSITGEVVAL